MIVRKYNPRDFKDLVDSGYVFGLHSFESGELRDLKIKALKALGEIIEEHLVALPIDQKKAVGFVTLRKITDTLFGVWNTFVHPDFRGRGISSLLYQSAFEHLAEKGLKKAVSSVAVSNIASVKGIKKTWDGFLSQRFYYIPNVDIELTGLPHYQSKLSKVPFSHLRKRMHDVLFATYKNCVNEDWYTFLEINRDNFLERFIDYPRYSQGILSMMFDKYVLFDESKCEGYVVIISYKIVESAEVHLFVSRGLPDNTVKSLLVKANQELRLRQKKGSIFCLADDELQFQRILSDLKLKAIPHLVPIKYL